MSSCFLIKLIFSFFPLQDYPTQLDFSTAPMAMAHLQPVSQASIISGNAMVGAVGAGGSGTLRRGILRGIVGVPPPDVTHHTNTTNMGGVQILHDLHPANLSGASSTQTTSTTLNGSMLSNSTPKQPQSILKDPNRNKHQQQQQQQHQQMLSASLMGVPGAAPGSLQILNIPTSMAGLSGNLLMTTSGNATAAYDPTNPHGLSTFNGASATMAYTDADGHLV